MKKLLIFILCFTLIIPLVSCSSGGSPSGVGYISHSEKSMPSTVDDGYDSKIQPGQLTSKAWSDNENFGHWLDLITNSENQEQDHYLKEIYDKLVFNQLQFNATNMLQVSVKASDKVVEGAKVYATKNDSVLFSSVSDSFGNAYLFFQDDVTENLTIKIDYNGKTFEKNITSFPENRLFEFELEDCVLVESAKQLDLCVILDTTGSMSDELEYLKVELKNVLTTISKEIKFDINLALIFYRDTGDEYVTKVKGFTKDLESQYANLGEQHAAGGGDFPEKVDAALKEASKLDWRENSTKLIIHLLDAPLHEDQNAYISFINSVKSFATKGIRMIPVICSAGGGDELLEFTMRYSALLTGGTYTYLTDDSGIGNNHSEPSTSDDIKVEFLNKMLIRLIKQYCTGVKIEPNSIYEEPVQEEKEYRVTFETNGGSEINAQLVKENGCVTAPEAPTRDGYVFMGWFTIEGSTSAKFDFTTPITKDITLYAVWIEYAVWEEIK